MYRPHFQRLYIFLYLLGSLIGCKESDIDNSIKSSMPSTETAMTSSLLDTEVTIIPALNVKNRVAWQKPDLILESLGNNLNNKTIADIGAGPTGFFTYLLARRGASVLAIDIDPSALAFIETEKTKVDPSIQALIKTRLAKPRDPHLKPNEVDGILIVNTIAYITDKNRYLADLWDKLKDSGKLVIVDFKLKRLPDQIAPPKSERVYPDLIEEILYNTGYKNIVVDDQSLEYQYIITADK